MKKILIDTQVFIWWILDDQQLIEKHRLYIENPGIDILVSTCSLFEVAIKKNIGKLTFDTNFKDALQINSFNQLSITTSHLEEYIDLPLIHRDPFDRMIVAQSNVEQVPLITYDKTIKEYDVRIL
jgi:PIN domain nuclease of toxin-antitoxin system